MKPRSIAWLFALALSITLHVRHPFLLHDGRYMAFAMAILVTSLLLPGIIVPVTLAAFHIDALKSHFAITSVAMVAVAALFWWYMGDRGRRIAGTFDAFEERTGKRPRAAQLFTSALNAIDRRRFGKEKTGRWA